MLDKPGLERLSRALNPQVVAVIGATKEPDRVGYSILESLLLGGYPGQILPIHPHHKVILGQKVYPSLDEAGLPVDLAILALNERASIEALDDCGRHEVKGAICVAGGYGEVGQEGAALQAELVAAAARNNILLVGPNTLGLINSRTHLNATFWPVTLKDGGVISAVSQSGGMGQLISFKMQQEGLTFNKWVGVGNRAMLDFEDFLQVLDQDLTTEVIAVFMEGTERARGFFELAGSIVERKPVVLMKAGRSESTQRFALTHTGSMAGSYRVYQDVADQFGVLMVDSIPEMVGVTKALSMAPPAPGTRVAILTPTAGPSIVMVDLLLDRGCTLAEFSPETMAAFEQRFVRVPVVLKNPLDASAVGYKAESYLDLAELILRDPGVDLLIALNIDHKNRVFPAEELVRLARRYGKPVLVCFIGPTDGASGLRDVCQAGGIPFYFSLEEAAWGAAGLVRRYLTLERLGVRHG